MYEMQQDYMSYVHRMALDDRSNCPTFAEIINKAATHRVSSLAMIPHSWYGNLEGGGGKKKAKDSDGSGSPLRDQAGTAPRVNPRPDTALMARFANSGHTSITAMIGSHNVEYPKINGKDVCMAWALKGNCSNNCRRAEMHINYGRPVIQKLHALMDACGVANPQP